MAPLVTVLAVVVPIPLFGALGLSLPLPATVERLAAKLVPFGNGSALGSPDTAVRGSIILVAAESGGRTAPTDSAGEPAAAPGRPAHAGTTRPIGDGSGHPEVMPRPTQEGTDLPSANPGTSVHASPAAPAPAPASTPAESGPTPTPTTSTPTATPPPPAPTVVDTVTSTATPVVSATVDAAKAVVDNTVPKTTGIVPGLPHP